MKMPRLLPVFDIVITPPKLLLMTLKLSIPLPLVFDTEIIPLLVRVPELTMPVVGTPEFVILSVVPVGTTSSSPEATVAPPALIVHVLVGTLHDPPYVGHEVASSTVVVACASCGTKVNNAKINTAKMER